MKYLLDKEEFDALVPRLELEKREAAMVNARDALLKATAYTCIHEQVEGGRYGGYCDDCPAFRIRHLCTLRKEVSK